MNRPKDTVLIMLMPLTLTVALITIIKYFLNFIWLPIRQLAGCAIVEHPMTKTGTFVILLLTTFIA